MGEHQNCCAGRAQDVRAGESEKDVTHVHYARIPEHPIESFLRDGDEANVGDVAEQQDNEQTGPILRAGWDERNRQTQQAIEAEFFQHTGVKHCRRGRSRGVRFRRPSVKRKERDEDAEAEKKKQINISLSVRRDLRSRSLQCAHVEGACASWNALIKQNQPEKQNKTPDREIDRNLPRRGRAIAASPNTDKQKSWDERELVEGVKEKQVQGRKSADCSA